jgi:hypothetical protein
MAKTPELFSPEVMMRLDRERDFQTLVEGMMRANRWSVYSVRRSDLAQASLAGYPDITAWRVEDRRLIFAELKTDTGRVSAAQEAVLDELRQLPSAEVYLWRPKNLEEIRKIVAFRE